MKAHALRPLAALRGVARPTDESAAVEATILGVGDALASHGGPYDAQIIRADPGGADASAAQLIAFTDSTR